MQANDVVANFSAADQDGKQISLSGLLDDGPVVLFFYPKAMTPG
jgi:peroxiredoxin Q/BCP